MAGTAEKYVGRSRRTCSKKRLAENLPTDADLPATAQRSQDADHDRVDVEEGQDQQAVVGGGQFEVLRHRLGHGLRVTVVEHHAFGTTGGTARVDQQGEVLAVEFHGRPGLVPADGPHPIDVDGRPASGGGVRTEVDDERRFGVVDLICRLVLGESGIDRGDRPAQSPGGEHGDEQFDPVRQQDRQYLASTESVFAELFGERLDPGVELLVGEFDTVVAETDVFPTSAQRACPIPR